MKQDEVVRVGAKRHLREVQDSCRAKEGKVPRIVAAALEFATEFDNQEAPGNAGPPVELVSVEDGLATPQVSEKDAKEQLASLQTKHKAPESGLLPGFSKHQEARRTRRKLCVSKQKRLRFILTKVV